MLVVTHRGIREHPGGRGEIPPTPYTAVPDLIEVEF